MNRRVDRINELLREVISELIARHLKDPRLAGLIISVTEVETTTDLRHARVFVSVFASEDERRSVLTALRSASGFIRREVAHRIVLRHMPELEFQLDTSIEHGDRILRLLKEVSPPPEPPRTRTRRKAAPPGDASDG